MAINQSDGSIILTTKVDNSGMQKGLGSMKKMAATAGKAFAAISVAAGAAAIAITKMAVDAYADYEQLVGGVETLFKDSADKVLKYAEDAFYTTGQSANEYMENVTAFSASLLSAVGGDTERAADIANAAMISMSDNANKMGSSMESVQMAFQGFAKQQYMLLDNLKLGYGGTKTEMQRLLKDAQAITGVKYDINNLADVYTAIGIIQEKLGIAGTTAKEAEKTISGAATMTKAAWKNVLAALGGGGDLDKAINNLVYSVKKYFENIVPVVKRALTGIGQLIESVAPQLVETIASALIQAIPSLVSAIFNMIIGLAKGIVNGIKSLIFGSEGVTAQLNGVASSADGASGAVAGLGNAAEEAGKKAKKALAAFDDVQILQDTSTAASESLDFGFSVSGVSGEVKEVADATNDIVTGWEKLTYEVMGKLDVSKLLNVENARERVTVAMNKALSGIDMDFDFTDAFAKIGDEISDWTTAGYTALASIMEMSWAYANEDDEGWWNSLGSLIGAGFQTGYGQYMFDREFGEGMAEAFFFPITENIENLYRGMSVESAKVLKLYIKEFGEAKKDIMKIKFWDTVITDKDIQKIEKSLGEAFDVVKNRALQMRETAELEMSTLIDKGLISEEEAEEALRKSEEVFDQRNETLEDAQKEITEILTVAKNEQRALTKDEENKISKIINEANTQNVSTIKAGAGAREEINRIMYDEENKMSAYQLAQIIRFANDEYEAKVEEANKTYDETIASAEMLYHDLGIINKDQYDDIVKKAKDTRNDTVRQAQLQREELVDEATLMAGDVANQVDPETGIIYSKWELLWREMKNEVRKVFTAEWWANLARSWCNSIRLVFQDAINGIIGAIESAANWFVQNFYNEIPWFDKRGTVRLGRVQIPMLAQGAVIPPNREFLAVLGDQKQGVNIETPLSTMIEAFQTALDSRGGNNGGNVEVVLEMDGREFGRAVVEQGNIENRRIGTRLVIV